MPSAHLSVRRTLRFRLTVWNTAIVFLFVLATLWGVREELQLFLWKEADEQLLDDASEVKATIEQLYSGADSSEKIYAELNRKAIAHTHRGLHFRIFDDRGELLWTSRNAPPLPFPTEYFK